MNEVIECVICKKYVKTYMNKCSCLSNFAQKKNFSLQANNVT